jgi:hypothetical protein
MEYGKYALLELEDIHDECGGVSRSGASGRRALARGEGERGRGKEEREEGTEAPWGRDGRRSTRVLRRFRPGNEKWQGPRKELGRRKLLGSAKRKA